MGITLIAQPGLYAKIYGYFKSQGVIVMHHAGSFIPCLTYGGEGSIFPGVNDIIMDEIKRQSSLYFK